MGTNTPNRNLYKPAVGEIGWGGPVDGNFDALDIAYFNAGTWINSSAYKINDIVSYNNTRYRASQAVPINTIPDVSPSYWDVFAITQTAPHGIKHLATGTDPVPSATDSTSGIMAAVDHAQLTANTTKLAGLPISIVAGANMTVTTVSGTMTLASSGGLSHTVWNSSTAYVAGDVVGLATGTVYACILGNTNQLPPNVTYWQPAGVSVSGTSPISVNGSGVVSIATAADGVAGAMSGSDHTTLTANTTKLSTLPSSVTGTAPVVVNGSGVVSMVAATDSVNGYLAAGDHTTYTANTTKLAGLPTSVTGTAPIAVASGAVSIQNATDAQAGAMTASDHTTLTAHSTKLATLPASVTGTLPISVNGSGVVSIATATDSVIGAMSAADHTQLTTNTANIATNTSNIATNTSNITTINSTIGSPNTASHFQQLDSNGRLVVVAGVPMDFGNDYIDGLATDGADMSIRCARNMTVNSGTIGFDANPAQTLTLTLQQRRAGSVIASATLTVSTGGVVTPAGFPIASILAGDRLRVNLSGTANVTGINYVFNARAES